MSNEAQHLGSCLFAGEAEQSTPSTAAAALDDEAPTPGGEEQMFDDSMYDLVPDRYNDSP